MRGVDHLVFAAPDLDEGIAFVAERLGFRPIVGGSHPGKGTRNALLGLGPRVYLEILAPDPDQPRPERGPWLGVEGIDAPRLVTWAAKANDPVRVAADARARGIPIGDVLEGSRARPDGTMLRWRLTDPQELVEGGVVPFFIDWGDSPHPADTAPSDLRLVRLRARHPEPERVGSMLSELGLDVVCEVAERVGLVAEVQTRQGVVELA